MQRTILLTALLVDAVILTGTKPLDCDDALRRRRWEPIDAVTPMQGDGDTYPECNPKDKEPT